MTAPPSSPGPTRQKLRQRKSLLELQERFSWKRRVLRNLKAGWKGALISIIAHALLMAAFGVVVYKIIRQEPTILYLSWATIVPEKTAEEVDTGPIQPISIPSLSMNNGPSVEKPVTAQQPKTPEPKERPATSPVNVADALSNRPKRSLAEPPPEGTDEQLRASLDRALRWIVQQQQEDGHWSLTGPYADAGTIETNTGATALALLALLGDGHTPNDGQFASAVHKGIQWLIRQQRPNGDLFDVLEEGKEAHFYAHAQGTIVLCEALALTGDESLRRPAERAVQFLIDAQNPKLGGWKYRPLNESGIGDLSVTGWALMALNTARMANIEPPYDTFRLADLFLSSVQENQINGSFYKYRPDFPVDSSQRLSMTGEGLLCRQWLGWPKDDFDMKRGVDFLISEANRPEWAANRRNVYAWYYTGQTLHNLGGARWESWFANVQQLILKHQAAAGPTSGSWHPHRPPGAFEERSRDAGRLYLTVMCVLILETPQRHRPLYE